MYDRKIKNISHLLEKIVENLVKFKPDRTLGRLCQQYVRYSDWANGNENYLEWCLGHAKRSKNKITTYKTTN
jgi:hypothetical protein